MAAPAWAENVEILIGPFGLTKPWTDQVSVVAVGCSQRGVAATNLIMYSDVNSSGPMTKSDRNSCTTPRSHDSRLFRSCSLRVLSKIPKVSGVSKPVMSRMLNPADKFIGPPERSAVFSSGTIRSLDLAIVIPGLAQWRLREVQSTSGPILYGICSEHSLGMLN
jgi:hypothetical protein